MQPHSRFLTFPVVFTFLCIPFCQITIAYDNDDTLHKVSRKDESAPTDLVCNFRSPSPQKKLIFIIFAEIRVIVFSDLGFFELYAFVFPIMISRSWFFVHQQWWPLSLFAVTSQIHGFTFFLL